MSAIDAQPFPKGALYAAAALIGATLLLVGGVRMQQTLLATEPAPISEVHGAVLQSRSLMFADGPDGEVLVQDVATGARLTLRDGSEGFVRGVLRALARQRSRQHLGQDAGAFTLAVHENGSLWLNDNATGERIELGGFGATNRAAFAYLLEQEGSR